MKITIIKSKVEHNGKMVNRYQVHEGDWDDSKPLPEPAKLTYSYRKAMSIAGIILAKSLVKVVDTEKAYDESKIIHNESASDSKKSK